MQDRAEFVLTQAPRFNASGYRCVPPLGRAVPISGQATKLAPGAAALRRRPQ